MNKQIRIAVLGLGRIGKMHIENLLSMKEFEIVCGVDPYISEETKRNLLELGVQRCLKDPEEVFSNPSIDAVLIASRTETHSDFIIRAARSGKAIFCEKPIDHDVDRIVEALKVVRETNAILQLGFVHRFDKQHARVRELAAEGKVGDIRFIRIISRDPAPASFEYISTSGGIHVDMMIHDFDMARYLANSEITEICAMGAVLCDDMFVAANDVDTAAVMLRFANGAIGVIDNSRSSGFGYDQRVEILGSHGCLMDQNVPTSNVLYFDENGFSGDPLYYFFLDRYHDAFIEELHQFAQAVQGKRDVPVNGYDGLQAVLVAKAALRSLRSGRIEKVNVLNF